MKVTITVMKRNKWYVELDDGRNFFIMHQDKVAKMVLHHKYPGLKKALENFGDTITFDDYKKHWKYRRKGEKKDVKRGVI